MTIKMGARDTRIPRRYLIPLSAAILGAAAAGCSTSSSGSSGSSKVISLAYSTNYVFVSPKVATAYMTAMGKQFQASHPGYTVKLVPIPGNGNDIVTKLSLLYRSPSTAPDVAEIPTGLLGSLVDSHDVLNLNSYVAKTSWWAHFPASIKAETTIDGNVYGANEGMNNTALYYSKALLTKAGVSMPWQPKSWADILAAAQAVKKTSPSVNPLFLLGGNGQGSVGSLLGADNFILGSTTPYIQDKAGKFVVDSPGLRETLGFYKSVAQGNLDAPLSQLLDPNALLFPEAQLAKGTVGIAVAGNYVGGEFLTADIGLGLGQTSCDPCVANSDSKFGVVEIPRETGGGAVSTLSGWNLPVYSRTKNPQAAFDLIDQIETKDNMIAGDVAAGWAPNDDRYINDPLYNKAAPTFNPFFAKLLASSATFPGTPDAVVWSTGFNNATEQILQKPGTSIDSAIKTLGDYVTGQLGAQKTVVVK